MRKQNKLLLILILGVFGIVNTQLGIVGILPAIADRFHISSSEAGLLVSLFALVVAISGPTMPLLLSGINRKKVMLLVLGTFILCNTVSAFTSSYPVLLIAYVVPAFLHPVYISLTLTVAAASYSKEDARKGVSKVFIGVSASMVLGAPLTNFLAVSVSLEMSLLSFAVINAVTFIATLAFIPSMPVKERLSYGTQLSVLKKSVIWLSIAAVILMNGAVFGVYSFLGEYLEKITKITANTTSILLLVYGAATIVGNIIAGKLLSKAAVKTVVSFPFALGAVYITLFLMGGLAVPMALIIFAWGLVGGIGGNINQYWITSAASEAPDFANGLFLTSANLGTTFGTTICGLFISGIGMQYVISGGLIFLASSLIFILLRNRKDSRAVHTV